MKMTLAITGLILFMTSSCEKGDGFHPFEKKEKKCPTISAEVLPASVKKAFADKYTGAESVVWFDKDGASYCTLFTSNGTEMKALYNRAGDFVSEEIEEEDENEGHERGEENDDESGCECDNDEEIED